MAGAVPGIMLPMLQFDNFFGAAESQSLHQEQ